MHPLVCAARDRRVRFGVAIGLSLAVAVAPAGRPRPEGSGPPTGVLLPDCVGAIRELVIHYVPEAAPIVETAYRDFLRQLPHDVVTYVLCPDRAAYEDLERRVGPTACRLVPVETDHDMTSWARDRWLGLATAGRAEPGILLLPAAEEGAALWPARRGDERIGFDLAKHLGNRPAAYRSRLHFDGGDFVADADTVFVTPRVLERNLGSTVASKEELHRALQDLLGRDVVLLSESPPHHAGMFMMAAGDGAVVVGDPSIAERLLRLSPDPCPIDHPDFSAQTQALFDAVAAQCRGHGYRVVRMPVVPAADGRTYLTYANVLLDERPDGRVVYMPVYHDAGTLNRAAEAAWRRLGYEVRPVDCTATYDHFGSLRCLVNVLSRGPAPRPSPQGQ